jgi:Uma2 family endonuclease
MNTRTLERESAVYPRAPGERLLSIAEFERLPEEDAYRIELVRGRLVREPRPASLHGVVSARLTARLQEFVERAGRGVVLADVGVVVARNPDTVRGPDIAFYTPERIPETGYGTAFWGPPDLAVEIASPSNRVAEMREKVAEYLEAGVRCVWVVDPPTRSVSVHRSDGAVRTVGEADVLEGDEVLPGFRLPLAWFFAL